MAHETLLQQKQFLQGLPQTTEHIWALRPWALTEKQQLLLLRDSTNPFHLHIFKKGDISNRCSSKTAETKL